MKRLLLILVFLLLASPVFATNYFVDKNNGAASDSNAGTNPAAPWLTIGKCASTLVAGDTCSVNAVDATYDARITPGASGTAGNIITYKASTDCISNSGQTVASPCPKVRGWTITSKNYITIQGFEVTSVGMSADGLRTISMTGADHITILNNYVHATDAPQGCLTAGSSSTNLIFRGNNVQYCGEQMDIFNTILGTYNISGSND